MNIFARELATLLGKRGKKLGSLYGLRSDTYYISPHKVKRLIRSMTEDITATLNAEELDILASWLQIDQNAEEFLRLRAALVAEGIHHLLSGRMDLAKADELGELAFRLLLGEEPEHYPALREDLLKGIRAGPPPAGVLVPTVYALEPAIKTYEQGALWLEIARVTSDLESQRGYISQARTFLEQARNLAINASVTKQDQAEQKDWSAIIDMALTTAYSLS